MSAFNLLPRIERYLRASKTPWTRIGRELANDPRLVGDMRNGRGPRKALADKIEAFLVAKGF